MVPYELKSLFKPLYYFISLENPQVNGILPLISRGVTVEITNQYGI